MSFDGKAFGKDIVAIVKSYVEKELAPIKAQLEALERGEVGTKYLGIWQRQQSYTPGNLVTKGGSLWHCNVAATGCEPGDGKIWTLAAKGDKPIVRVHAGKAPA